MRANQKMTRVGFEPTPSVEDQELIQVAAKVNLNLTPWTARPSCHLVFDGSVYCLSRGQYWLMGEYTYLYGVLFWID